VLDVGAFVGNYAVELRELGYKGHIFSFEPHPDSFSKMSSRLNGDPYWRGLPYGLSDKSRNAVIHTYARGDFNSLLVMKKDAERAFCLKDDISSDTHISLRKLDEVLPALLAGMDSPRVFLKIDTQGHDMNVLRGAAGVRKWIIGLQSEMAAICIYDDMPAMSDMLKYYQSLDFVPVGFYPVNTFRNKRVSPEFDVIFNSFDGTI
jgi:FkbM family methyltransferase